MPQPRSKVTLSADERDALAEAFRLAREDHAAFPVDSDRRERLDRWIGRLEERAAAPGPADFRVAPADWDVLQAGLGLLLKRLRAQSKRHFEVLQAALLDATAVSESDLADARSDLARLDRVQALSDQLRARLAHEDERAARRRWILP